MAQYWMIVTSEKKLRGDQGTKFFHSGSEIKTSQKSHGYAAGRQIGLLYYRYTKICRDRRSDFNFF